MMMSIEYDTSSDDDLEDNQEIYVDNVNQS